MSNSPKSDSNKENISYLVLYAYHAEGNDFDHDSYLIVQGDIQEILAKAHEAWDCNIDAEEHLRIIPFYESQIKRIKQTLELV